jgi:hypothetical protein
MGNFFMSNTNSIATARTLLDSALAGTLLTVVQAYNTALHRHINQLLFIDRAGMVVGGRWEALNLSTEYRLESADQYLFDPSVWDYWQSIDQWSDIKGSSTIHERVISDDYEFSYSQQYTLFHSIDGGQCPLTRDQYVDVTINRNFSKTVLELLHRMTNNRGFHLTDIRARASFDSRLLRK